MDKLNLLRIEFTETGIGMWHTLKEDSEEPLVSLLTNEEIAKLPMPYSEVYGQKGRRWYSAVPTVDMLKMWFSKQDAIELLDLGFQITQFDVTEWKHLESETIFTRESVSNWKVLELADIYT